MSYDFAVLNNKFHEIKESDFISQLYIYNNKNVWQSSALSTCLASFNQIARLQSKIPRRKNRSIIKDQTSLYQNTKNRKTSLENESVYSF